jgi:hypothetical protein
LGISLCHTEQLGSQFEFFQKTSAKILIIYFFFFSFKDALVHSDKLGLRGFRKQLSGRFKRLVSRKSHEPTPVIPPELKPQLKTIYVY